MNHPACWEWETPWPMKAIPIISNKEMGIEFFRYHRGRCSVCGNTLANKSSAAYIPKFKTFGAIDDNHKTRMVRGLLCWPCNTFEGHHRGLFYASFNGGIELPGHNDCNRCKLFDMYRVLNPAEILGMKISLGEFSPMFSSDNREAYTRDWQ